MYSTRWVQFQVGSNLVQIGSKRPKLDVETGAIPDRCGIPMKWFCVDDFPKYSCEVLIEGLFFSIFDEMRERIREKKKMA